MYIKLERLANLERCNLRWFDFVCLCCVRDFQERSPFDHDPMEPQEREQLNLMSLQDLQTIIFQKLDDYQVKDSEDFTISLLHGLLEFAPSDVGRHNVAVDIASCLTDCCLRQLANRYWTGLILPSELFPRPVPLSPMSANFG